MPFLPLGILLRDQFYEGLSELGTESIVIRRLPCRLVDDGLDNGPPPCTSVDRRHYTTA